MAIKVRTGLRAGEAACADVCDHDKDACAKSCERSYAGAMLLRCANACSVNLLDCYVRCDKG